ncbi:MAG TPA: metal-dependent hydrolase [Acidimicrobiales bacterium]|nr:metal-dependent hydrolase [Acidimicrobiales bacterium]
MTHPAKPSAGEVPTRDIPVRRLEPFPANHISPVFAGGDPVMSHAVAVLSAMFPNGEDFFVRSVRNYRDGHELLRRVTMEAMTAFFLGGLVVGTAYSATANSGLRDVPGLIRSVARLHRSPFLASAVVRRIRSHNQPDFHPDDFDATELLERWKAELFGSGGVLAERVTT